MIKETELRDKISKNLIYYRKKNGYTQGDVAKLISYSDKAVSKWERGFGLPDILVLSNLAEIYNISVSDLIGDKKEDFDLIAGDIEDPQIYLNKKHKLIAYMSMGLVWLLASILFFTFQMVFRNRENLKFYLFFIYSIPATFIVALVFNILWGKRKLDAIIESLLPWSLAFAIIITIYPNLNDPTIFFILLIPTSFQALIILWNTFLITKIKFKNKNNKEDNN